MAELFGQVLVADVAEGPAPVVETMQGLGSGLDCGWAIGSGDGAGLRPTRGNLPPKWGVRQQLEAVAAGLYDTQHGAEQLATKYCGYSDQQWVEAIEGCLLSGESFRA